MVLSGWFSSPYYFFAVHLMEKTQFFLKKCTAKSIIWRLITRTYARLEGILKRLQACELRVNDHLLRHYSTFCLQA